MLIAALAVILVFALAAFIQGPRVPARVRDDLDGENERKSDSGFERGRSHFSHQFIEF